jgi:hypothetical protein
VPRHFLSVLCDGDPVPLTEGSGRMQLANLIVKQPIAMRVIVNRIWKGHFGTGIVDTPSNFGFGGERPTDPELLEYLAQTFVKDGMSIKKLQREIMLSATYQLSTENNQADFEKDSGNRLYWRANRKRMDAEQIRDSILDVAGNLDTMIEGPSQELTPEFKGRTVYGKVSRYKLDAYLQLFDFPPPEHQRREALHDHCSAAAAVSHEQRFCPVGSRSAGQASGGGTGQSSAYSQDLQLDLRPFAQRKGDADRSRTICIPSRRKSTKKTRTNPRTRPKTNRIRLLRMLRPGRQRRRGRGGSAGGRSRRLPMQPRCNMGMGMMAGMDGPGAARERRREGGGEV